VQGRFSAVLDGMGRNQKLSGVPIAIEIDQRRGSITPRK
jgi:hypothetical protein